jgi:YbbR domain-containing protein
MSRILRSIISNIATLLLSLLVAVIIWFNASQVEDVTVRQTLQIPINIVGIPENGILIRPEADTVQPLLVGYEGPESIVTSLTVDEFIATVDLSNVMYGQETAVPVQVQISGGDDISVVFQSLEEVRVLLEQSISRDIPVDLDIRGTVARGHTQGTPLIDPAFIAVSGPASSVEQLNSILLTIFLNNARETQVYSPQLIFYDLQGRVTSTRNLSLSADEVQVTIPINESASFAEKFITVERRGEPAPGYRLLNVTVEPDSIYVTGPPGQLNSLERLSTEPIDITGLTQSTRLQVTLDLPEGVRLDQDQEIFVDIEIEPRYDTTSFRRDVEVLGLEPDMEVVEIRPEDVRIIFYGPVLALNTILETDVRVTVDLFELEEGTYSIMPEVVFPERGIELRSVQPSAVTVEITRMQNITDTITKTLSLPKTSSLLPTFDTVSYNQTCSDLAYLFSWAYDPPFAYLERRERT